MIKKRLAFSIIEVILAAALFVIFASGAIGVVLFGLDMNRLGGEQTIANQYASEGIEATRSIKNQSFSNLINSVATGISQSNGVWIFSGVNNTFDKYSRVIKIEDVYRDVANNIVSSGGTLDNQTKKITSTVSWNVSGSRNNSIELITYLTNWKALISTSTCNSYAISQGYGSGICRQTVTQCTNNGETNLVSGDIYCTIPPADTCCVTSGSTPTPTSTPIATPTPTLTPTPTIVITNCNQFCQATYSLPGSCRKSNQCTGTKSPNKYECNNPNICCCQ